MFVNELELTKNNIFSDKTLDLWVKKNNWKVSEKTVSIATQDVTIKTKNITEKIEFDNLGAIMAQCL